MNLHNLAKYKAEVNWKIHFQQIVLPFKVHFKKDVTLNTVKLNM